ncbi:MAG: FAD-binding oxidoreductase [Kordiimonadaceae bacterium]|jgi:D-arginine dehydrogenase|nr:FAD-binding oxidoreductase [Kordiimonadaceae bacterium]MBT6031230.1 FAD-binding oxidoreductase [Kordiimonadaceae bacterium]
MNKADYIIIGAGIAGASAAYELSKKGKVIVLEQEDQPGFHSTGRSAAVFETTYKQGDPVIRALVLASEDFFKNPPEGFAEHDLLKFRPQIYIAKKEQNAELREFYNSISQITDNASLISHDDILKYAPVLNDDYSHEAILLLNDLADIDVHSLHDGFLKGIKNHGSEVIVNAKVTAIEKTGDDWQLSTADEKYSSPIIINAAGAWVDQVAKMAGVKEIGIKPLRRTMVLIDPQTGDKNIDDWAMVVEYQEEYYFKPDAGKILISPCDTTVSEPCDAQPEEIDIAYAAHYYGQCTGTEVTKVDYKWAGLRNSLPDGYPAVGFAPDGPGFFWLAGQEGFGIKTSPAMGRLTSALVKGEAIPEDIKDFSLDERLISVDRFAKIIGGQ